MAAKTFALLGVAAATLGACGQNSAQNTSSTPPAAAAAAPTTRVRGVLQGISPTALTVQTYDGRSVTTPVDAKTGVLWVVPSSLSAVKDGDFIGTATTGPDDALKAVELVIFPAAMRGTGEGHYDWDIPGVIAAKGGGASGTSAMTNGTVQHHSAMTNGTVQHSAMTNGVVASGASAGDGATMLTVSYKGGLSKVTVPAGTPIVRFEPTQSAVLAPGQKVFIVPSDGGAAKLVAIGKNGLTPPM